MSIVICALYSTQSIAIESEINALNRELDLHTPYLSWMPGERYDPNKGTLEYSSTDLSMPGNGKLPIEIKRTFYQRPESTANFQGVELDATSSFGMMDLSLPQVMFALGAGQYNGCHKSGLSFTTPRTGGRHEPSWRVLNSPIIFTDGDREVTFYEVSSHNAHLATTSNGVEPDYISQDNWRIKCHDSRPRTTYRPRSSSKLTVISPDNIQYHMTGGTRRNSARYRLTKVEDAYGNWLTYGYEDLDLRRTMPAEERAGRTRKLSLISITADDDRRVELDYEYTGSSWRIVGVTGNGQPNPRKIVYKYPRGGTRLSLLDVIENDVYQRQYLIEDGKITSITYPTSGKISYTYTESTNKTGGVPYKAVATRTSEPDGGVFRFERQKVNDYVFSRVIRTPGSATEYRFRISEAKRTGNLHPFTAESGNVIRYKVFDNPDFAWSSVAKESILLDRTYEYKILYNLASRELRQDAARIVLDKVVTGMNYTGGRYATALTKDYQSYDFRGYLTKLAETSGQSSNINSRTSFISYQHDHIDSDQMGKPTVVNIDNMDITENSYEKGDLTSVRACHKIT